MSQSTPPKGLTSFLGDAGLQPVETPEQKEKRRAELDAIEAELKGLQKGQRDAQAAGFFEPPANRFLRADGTVSPDEPPLEQADPAKALGDALGLVEVKLPQVREAGMVAGEKIEAGDAVGITDENKVVSIDHGKGDDRTVYGPSSASRMMTLMINCREVAARIWCDPKYSEVTMDVAACEKIAVILAKVVMGTPITNKHSLVSIGSPPERVCYLDVPREEAVRRYVDTIGSTVERLERGRQVTEFEFEDSFRVSDAWPVQTGPRT